MNHSVRSLLPSLLLIGIYFIADEFFGTVTGVWVAFLLGGAEFIYTRIREKVYDKMILLTTLFFCIPGLGTRKKAKYLIIQYLAFSFA